MSVAVILATLVALSSHGVAASRSLQQAPAPSPAATPPAPVDGVLALTAGQAAFVNSTALVLSGIANSTSYVKFPPAPKAGSVSQSYLTSANMADTTGKWAGNPQASLSGSYNGNMSTVLLRLDAPKYDSMMNTITFAYTVLPVNSSSLPALGGTVNSIVSSYNGAEGNSMSVLPYVTPGATMFMNASLAVDVAGILGFVAPPPSAEKAGLIRIPLGWSGWGYWG
ncbi:g10143 [Coccomyxa elongata]